MNKANLIQYPSGSYGFAGSVPYQLSFTRQDGSEPSMREVEDDLRLPPYYRRLRPRIFLTALEAMLTAADLGFEEFSTNE